MNGDTLIKYPLTLIACSKNTLTVTLLKKIHLVAP